MVRMWAWSRKAEWGRVTDRLAEVRIAGSGLTTARRAGWSPRLVPPSRLSESFGLKPEASTVRRLEARGETDRHVVGGIEDVGEAAEQGRPDLEGSQLVGLRVKPGRST